MELHALSPRRWQDRPWWRVLMLALAVLCLVPTLVWGTRDRWQAYVVTADGLAAGKLHLEPDVRRFYELAREMRHPYQSRHREPLHILLIKGSLVLFGDRPASVLIPTLVASVLLIPATFLFGRAVYNLPVGLAGAALVAFNHHLIRSAARGYRLELFAVLMLAYVYVLFVTERRQPKSRLLAAGVLGGLLLLVRITTVTLLVPALALVIWRERRRVERLRSLIGWAGVSLIISLAILAPYVLECGLVHGRPLLAIDRHAQWWAEAEAGQMGKSTAEETSLSVFQYLFGAGGIWRTLVRSLHGYWLIARMMPWYGGSWKLLFPFVVAGMVMTAVRRQRYLLWVTVWVLLPFTVVMPVGGDVRFFMFLYPFYALWAVVGLYPLVFGVLYYVVPGWALRSAGSAERSSAAEVSSDECPQESSPGD